jgi:hypothetical protein
MFTIIVSHRIGSLLKKYPVVSLSIPSSLFMNPRQQLIYVLSAVLSFQKYHVFELIQQVSFSDLFHLAIYIEVSFTFFHGLRVISFQHRIILHCINMIQFFNLFIHQMTSYLFPSLGSYE